MTAKPLHVLIVDDSDDDAFLTIRELRRGHYDPIFLRVDDPESLRRALDEGAWDLVICDWHMPLLTAPGTLAEVQERGLDLPFLVVSGTVGEETAVSALQAGAHDFISKGRLTRLLSAVERGLRDAAVRRARVAAEKEGRESEARYRAMFAASPLPMWLYDPTTLAFLAVNDAAVRHYGYTAEEFERMTIADLRWPEDLAALREAVAQRDGRPQTWRHRTKDGTPLWVEINAHDLELNGRNARLVLANDVTERVRAEGMLRKTEEQLRQAQKMEAVGRLAGGIAHDFNNVLSVILSYCELMADALPPGDRMREDVDEVRKAATRAADMTRQLLTFSRQQLVRPRVLDLNEVVRSVDKMLRRMVGEDVELTFLTGATGKIHADQGQVEQVLMNLVINARDAMPRGGKITIETSSVVLDEEFVHLHVGAKTGGHTLLAVTDTGVGMDKETQERIFEPFFTTKEVGKGTGLGLATVHGIVQQAEGTIWVYSEQGKGTTFRVYLPQTELAERPVETGRDRSQLEGTETILLVEDEEQLRVVGRNVLARHGYEVLEARDVAEALAKARSHRGAIDLLLTDVVMPGGSGPDLAAQLASRRPRMKVLCMSGYTSDTVVRHGIIASGMAFLQKPVTPDALLRRVRELLDAPRDAPTKRRGRKST